MEWGSPPPGRPRRSAAPPRCSFPGGKREAADGGAEGTALREAREELGLKLREESVWGRLRGLPERVRSGDANGDRGAAVGRGDGRGVEGRGDRGAAPGRWGVAQRHGDRTGIWDKRGTWGQQWDVGAWAERRVGTVRRAEWGQGQRGDTGQNGGITDRGTLGIE